MAAPSEANAVECGNCSGVTMGHDIMECSQCGTDDYLIPVVVIPCPEEHPAECGDEFHHFGMNKHVTPTTT